MKTSNRTEDFIPYEAQTYTPEEMIQRSKDYFEYANKRRSLREFSDKPVPMEVIENIILSASTAPSGAHKQPWTFCVVKDADMKAKIREAAEEEEKINYSGRMSDEWLDDLKIFATDDVKEFLTLAPYLIIVCKKTYDIVEEGKSKNYYVNESVGLAAGFLLNAIHNAGLVALTHTPSPMGFLTKILDRPENEKPFLLIPVGYPADDAHVPNLGRKGLEDVMVVY
jgi:nitroreductase